MVFQESRKLLGSECLITLNAKDLSSAESLFEILFDTIIEFENKFTRFKETSELTKLNISSGTRFKASDELVDILKTAKQCSKKTNGLYNPFILPLLQQAGYKGSWPDINKFNKGLDFSDRKLKPIDDLIIEGNYVTIPEDSAIDLGGIGKGYLLKKLSKKIPESISGYWISLGGDILVNGKNEDNLPWRIYIENASKETNVAYVENDGMLSIATSGVTKRSKKGWNHLINPNTGVSIKNNILTATVVCKDPIMADILASCVVLAESDDLNKLEKIHEFDGLIQFNIDAKHSNNIQYLGNRSTFYP